MQLVQRNDLGYIAGFSLALEANTMTSVWENDWLSDGDVFDWGINKLSKSFHWQLLLRMAGHP